jgi:hypothetical protein
MLFYKFTLVLVLAVTISLFCSPSLYAGPKEEAEQLREFFAENLIQLMSQRYKDQVYLQNKNYQAKVKKCFKKVVKDNFTVEELRYIFLSPDPMTDQDKVYLNNKIQQISPRGIKCFQDALK